MLALRKKLLLPWIGVALLALQLRCAHSPTKASVEEQAAYFELGLSFYSDGRYPEAIQHFQAAYDADPRRSDILMHLALAQMKMEQFTAAEQSMRQACAQEKVYPECWNNLAVIYLRAGKFSEAESASRRALETPTYKTPEVALANLAQAQLALGQLKNAEASAQKAIRLKPDACQERLLLAKIRFVQGDIEEALKESRSAVMRCPLVPNAHHWEAYLLVKIGQRKSAVAKLQRIINTFPNNAEYVEKSRRAIEKINRRLAIEEPAL